MISNNTQEQENEYNILSESKKNNELYKKNNKFPVEYENKIINRDCVEVMKELPDNCVDLIVTSPPYNFNKRYLTYRDKKPLEEYKTFIFNVLDECIRILKYGGRICINIQPLCSNYVPTHFFIANHILEKEEMIWRTDFIWNKQHYGCATSTWGSFLLPSSPYVKFLHEYILVFSKGTLKHESENKQTDLNKEEFLEFTKSIWTLQPETNMKKYKHPAMFPESIPYRLIKFYSFVNDLVFDPFNGAGTTTFVAKQLKRRFLGTEIDKTYYEMSINRTLGVLDI